MINGRVIFLRLLINASMTFFLMFNRAFCCITSYYDRVYQRSLALLSVKLREFFDYEGITIFSLLLFRYLTFFFIDLCKFNLT